MLEQVGLDSLKHTVKIYWIDSNVRFWKDESCATISILLKIETEVAEKERFLYIRCSSATAWRRMH